MKKAKILPILMLSTLCFSCSHTTSYSVRDYRTTMKFHDNFKIMQLTDLHLGIESDLVEQLTFISNSIDYADPDLIILTGDNFMYSTKGIVNQLLKTLNNKCKELSSKHKDRITKFAITYGNHDNQGDYHRYYINSQVKKYVTSDGDEVKDHKYAAFIDFQDDDLDGLTNYYIDLVDDQSKNEDTVDVKYRIHIIDSNTYHFIPSGLEYNYDVIYESQLEHVEKIYNEATKDKDYVGLSFFHIPFAQYEEAIEQYNSSSNPSLVGQGLINEPVADPYKDNNSFERLRKSNIVSYNVGHDHMNAFDIIYNYEDASIDNKAILSYGVKSTNQLYHDVGMIGYKIINLRDNMTIEKFLTIENINENFRYVLDRGEDYGQ